ncbi:hypothetical protein N5E96_23935 [Pseudomonas mosselii]|uniref:hypothetical protein n=1 Tax=Pseudomonas TaxID=286 RepID=UPI001F1CEB05|nr:MULTISPECIES: hypothetical protein [Pseudomonas]MCF1487186.1 hypothetical protein [Pseudomonas sp. AA27]MDH1657002.1 hypothetical protein [Pseudomonas mosselii]MDH1719505.1 hypothetical protein [Pseudomonas mosselii]MDH1724341.1 hypothetical protein [Pseudomonas mosselii]
MKIHYVAFLDILGFKELVGREVRDGSGLYLDKLLRCHRKCTEIFNGDSGLSIVQFSDSVVITKPYDAADFRGFVSLIADYQRYLLDEELLCRGGVAVNQHFSNGSFTFSAGLIDAYTVESTAARYPRVVVSSDVIDLVCPEGKVPIELVREDDGLYFVDYLGITKSKRPAHLTRSVKNVVSSLERSKVPSVREKGIWLAGYSDAVLGTDYAPSRFRGGRVA